MHKKILVLVLVLGFSLIVVPSFPKEFGDISEKHWAREFVQKVVESGILSGYSDGTFRGNKTITRYEIAKIISNLLEIMGESGDVTLEDLQVDLKAIKTELQTLRAGRAGGAPLRGTFLMRGRLGGILTTGSRTPRTDFRLTTGFTQKGSEGAEIAFGLDTMDVGYNNALATNLFQDLLDARATLSMNMGWENPANIEIYFGPGPTLHTEPAGLTVDSGKYYMRPRTGLSVRTQMAGVDLTGKYSVVAGSRTTGIVTGHHFQFTSGLDVSNWINRDGTVLSASIDFVRAGGTNDLGGRVGVKTPLLPRLEAAGILGVAALDGSGLHGGLDLVADDILGTGTIFGLQIHRVASSYIPIPLVAVEFDFAGFDYFDRARANGTWDIGFRMTHPISEILALEILWNTRRDGDFRYSGASASNAFRGSLTYSVAAQTQLVGSYEQFGTAAGPSDDLLSMALQYHF